MLIILLKARLIFKIVQVILLSSVKFIFAPPVSIEMGFNYAQTLLATTAGGIIGVIFFYHLSGWIINFYRTKISPVFARKRHRQHSETSKVRRSKTFSWRNKTLVKIRRKWGLFGIAALTPTILSIPIGSFLASKYYSKNRNTLVYLSISVAVWSVIVSTVYFFTF